ncbi:electron transfer flavoprotein subunit alpha/FixB family protein [Bordetella avium]|uniref:Electron transfer flavoprotein alpha-subunit n=1 Tax=Bordetella avium (strain 197N) TaxID=360910 RepID=Q2KTY8_BORA1|nr:electron transfer flavoprotein subunit alpha/FixB family protein [Bordetella avium]RIQ15244.1 electron transfer flavoprotein subunit alpha/FixB family protein [Bordetella avium]RIQ38645.1 electron transfer flavoprotein subunit alpha/FixB family protein [Bordetella avium]RIQ43185.1 electron transfer flavoprotein subunit alpha/FixB family protein [Bordetella avium]RIQ43880.1 electron transfer flavoprotein subunit alpha/FixB family protein [Bordetella avium]RIQ53205.1 electron transfer flavopr
MTPPRQIVLVLPPADCCDAPYALLQAASALAQGGTLTVLALAGAGSPGIAPLALPGPAHWWQCQHPALQRLDAAHLLPCIQEALEHLGAAARSLILLPPGPLSEECAALLAASLQGDHLGRCVQIKIAADGVSAERQAFGGRVALRLDSRSDICTATWRPAPAAGAEAGIAPQVHAMPLQAELPAPVQAAVLEPDDRLPPLENARLVVSGGRGMQGEAGFSLLADIAQQLGASLGGSLPTVDAGWVPVARQIGQSGKFVNPKIYFTVGISGTPQHMAGVSQDSRIIAVNKDPEAPIFQRAQYGVVAEWQNLLPALLEALRTAA